MPPIEPVPLAPAPVGRISCPMRIVAVINAASGALVGMPPEAITARFEPLFAVAASAAGPVEAEIVVASGAAILPALEAAARSGCDLMVVGGGDGTVLAAVDCAMRHGTLLGLIPLGTANVLARDLGIPLVPEQAVPAIMTGERRRIDVATVNGELFLNSALIGIGPVMVTQRERLRRVPGLGKWLTLARVFLRAFDRPSRLRVLLRADGRARRVKARAIAVTNNPLDSGFGALHARSRLDTGRLGVYVTRARRRADLWRQLFRVVVGSWQTDRAMETMVTTRLDVRTRRKRLWVAIDGENRLLATPLRFRMRPAALEILAPATAERPQTDQAA